LLAAFFYLKTGVYNKAKKIGSQNIMEGGHNSYDTSIPHRKLGQTHKQHS